MRAEKLKTGDTIGIISPSHIAVAEQYEKLIANIKALGFKVKTGSNLYKNTYGFSATETERANDLNQMVADEAVKLIFFGGGYGSIDLLPLIDYKNIEKHPKLFLSYSDGTSILNAVYAKTGLITYYGQSPGNFEETDEYNQKQFYSHLVLGNPGYFVGNSVWHSQTKGICRGLLVGGYTLNFCLSLNSPYFKINKSKKYILFLEDHEKFSCVAAVAMFLSHIEQSGFMDNCTGLLFGNYSDTLSEQLLGRLERFGQKHRIPVAYCDDFGHGKNRAILPVGCEAILDTSANTLEFIC